MTDRTADGAVDRGALATTGDTTGDATVAALILAQAARTPDACAVRAPDGRLTYGELVARAEHVARRLLSAGVQAETLVGVCLRRGVHLLPAVLGIWHSGAAYLPLDPDLPDARIARMLGDARAPLVLTSADLQARFERHHSGAVLVMDDDSSAGDGHGAGEGHGAGDVPSVRTWPDQLAYVIYTSGSTGDPKGVMVHHRGLTNYLSWTARTYAVADGGSPVFSSISFDLGIPDLLTPLLVGQPVHLLPDPVDVTDLGRQLAAGGPYSFVKMTPGHLDLLTQQLTPVQARDLAGLVIAAGDSFTTDLAVRWVDLAGPGGTRVATEYGPTEITIGNSGQLADPDGGTDLVPLGDPIPRTTMHVLDDALHPAPAGEAGEIWIGGVGVARGYLGRPAMTAERFVPDPYGAPGSRFYRSGDLGRRLPDGRLEFLGRTDDQVKIRGYRIELGEIRALLCRHPHIRDAVVAAPAGTPAARRLVAYVVLAPGCPLDGQALGAHVADALPDYMLPHAFVALERIPLTTNGKVDHGALPVLL